MYSLILRRNKSMTNMEKMVSKEAWEHPEETPVACLTLEMDRTSATITMEILEQHFLSSLVMLIRLSHFLLEAPEAWEAWEATWEDNKTWILIWMKYWEGLVEETWV